MCAVRKPLIFKSAASFVVGLLALTACSPTPDATTSRSTVEYQPVSLEEATSVDDVVRATTEIGAAALQFHDAEENVVLSPASIAMAFAMLAEGAEAEAAEELDGFLGASQDERTQAFSALQATLAQYDGDPASIHDEELPERPMVHMANHTVVRNDGDVKATYLDTLAKHYDAGVQEVDFSSDTAQRILDEWVNHHTGGLIEESGVEPTEKTLMVLQNAILMAAAWAAPFETAQPGDFTLPGGKLIQTDIMEQIVTAQYTEYQNAQIVRLPYTESFAMDIVLPAEAQSARSLSAADWEQISQRLTRENATTQVDLSMPVMDLSSPRETTDLLRFLSDDQGLDQTLAGNSLDGIMESDLWIESVNHQAVLQVDEAGTVAAAVTEIGVAEISAPVVEDSVEMHVDRPFVLRIVHTETEWPLFMAAVSDPR